MADKLTRTDYLRIYDAARIMALCQLHHIGIIQSGVDRFISVEFPIPATVEIDNVKRLANLAYLSSRGGPPPVGQTIDPASDLGELAVRVLFATGFAQAGDPILAKLIAPNRLPISARRFGTSAASFRPPLLRRPDTPLYALLPRKGVFSFDPVTHSYLTYIQVGEAGYKISVFIKGHAARFVVASQEGEHLFETTELPVITVGKERRRLILHKDSQGWTYSGRLPINSGKEIRISAYHSTKPTHELEITTAPPFAPRAKPHTTPYREGHSPHAPRGGPMPDMRVIKLRRGRPDPVRPPERPLVRGNPPDSNGATGLFEPEPRGRIGRGRTETRTEADGMDRPRPRRRPFVIP